MSDAEQSGDLIDQAVAGDRASLERLLLDHYTPLAANIGSRLPMQLQSVVGVEDIIQQTFTQVFGDITRYERREDATFFAWLTAIAENRLHDAIRAQQRKKRGGDFHRMVPAPAEHDRRAADLFDAIAGRGPTASQWLARREGIHAIRIAVAGLPDDYRRAIELRYFDGRSLDETAVLMGRTTGAVRGLIDRAKKQIREALGRASHYLSSK